jgi:hypothetical protein
MALGLWCAILCAGPGCAAPAEDKDSAAAEAPADTGPEQPSKDEDCAVLELKLVGPESPVVGDSITVILRCDGAPLVGTSVLRVTPLDNADVQDNVVTFTRSGPINVRLQVGSRAADVDLVVGA